MRVGVGSGGRIALSGELPAEVLACSSVRSGGAGVPDGVGSDVVAFRSLVSSTPSVETCHISVLDVENTRPSSRE